MNNQQNAWAAIQQQMQQQMQLAQQMQPAGAGAQNPFSNNSNPETQVQIFGAPTTQVDMNQMLQILQNLPRAPDGYTAVIESRPGGGGSMTICVDGGVYQTSF